MPFDIGRTPNSNLPRKSIERFRLELANGHRKVGKSELSVRNLKFSKKLIQSAGRSRRLLEPGVFRVSKLKQKLSKIGPESGGRIKMSRPTSWWSPGRLRGDAVLAGLPEKTPSNSPPSVYEADDWQRLPSMPQREGQD